MARRPAYNTKAERQRRLGEREETFAAALSEGEVAELFVPALRAWLEFRRSVHEYESLQAEPLESADTRDRVSVAKVRDIAWVAVAADSARGALTRAAAVMASEAERAISKAGLKAMTLAPYTAAEKEAMAALSSSSES